MTRIRLKGWKNTCSSCFEHLLVFDRINVFIPLSPWSQSLTHVLALLLVTGQSAGSARQVSTASDSSGVENSKETLGRLYLIRDFLGRMKVGGSLQKSKGHQSRIHGASACTFYGVMQALFAPVEVNLGVCPDTKTAEQRLKVYEMCILVIFWCFLVHWAHEVSLSLMCHTHAVKKHAHVCAQWRESAYF